jgi:hypothetical protein
VLNAVFGLHATLWLCAGGYLLALLYPGWRVTWKTSAPIGEPQPQAEAASRR